MSEINCEKCWWHGQPIDCPADFDLDTRKCKNFKGKEKSNVKMLTFPNESLEKLYQKKTQKGFEKMSKLLNIPSSQQLEEQIEQLQTREDNLLRESERYRTVCRYVLSADYLCRETLLAILGIEEEKEKELK